VTQHTQEYSVRLGRVLLTNKVHKSTLKDNMTENIDEFLTIEELAKILKVTKVTLYRMARSGKIPAMKFGKSWRVSSRLLEDMKSGRWTND
jgi:excisionase family DNA binding protein